MCIRDSSGSGLLACGDTGSGRLPDEGILVDYVARELEHEKDMQGMNCLLYTSRCV